MCSMGKNEIFKLMCVFAKLTKRKWGDFVENWLQKRTYKLQKQQYHYHHILRSYSCFKMNTLSSENWHTTFTRPSFNLKWTETVFWVMALQNKVKFGSTCRIRWLMKFVLKGLQLCEPFNGSILSAQFFWSENQKIKPLLTSIFMKIEPWKNHHQLGVSKDTTQYRWKCASKEGTETWYKGQKHSTQQLTSYTRFQIQAVLSFIGHRPWRSLDEVPGSTKRQKISEICFVFT